MDSNDKKDIAIRVLTSTLYSVINDMADVKRVEVDAEIEKVSAST